MSAPWAARSRGHVDQTRAMETNRNPFFIADIVDLTNPDETFQNPPLPSLMQKSQNVFVDLTIDGETAPPRVSPRESHSTENSTNDDAVIDLIGSRHIIKQNKEVNAESNTQLRNEKSRTMLCTEYQDDICIIEDATQESFPKITGTQKARQESQTDPKANHKKKPERKRITKNNPCNKLSKGRLTSLKKTLNRFGTKVKPVVIAKKKETECLSTKNHDRNRANKKIKTSTNVNKKCSTVNESEQANVQPQTSKAVVLHGSHQDDSIVNMDFTGMKCQCSIVLRRVLHSENHMLCITCQKHCKYTYIVLAN